MIRIKGLETETRKKSEHLQELEGRVSAMERLISLECTDMFMGFGSVLRLKDTEIERLSGVVSALKDSIVRLENQIDDHEAHQLVVSMPYSLPSLDIYGFMHHGRIKIPYPLQWGAPTFSAGHPFGMMADVLVSMIESTGAFKTASRLASATPPLAHLLSHGNWDPFQWTFWDSYMIYSFCVSLWDGIIPSKEHAKFWIHTTNKYRFTDQGSNLQGKEFNLTLHWHVMPKTGEMFADKIVMSGFSLPVEYR
ncbi:hypothetical protein TEA_003877 [Camellia sinensis var. sinensis]|uniref:Signal peptidase complex subunit 3 n=1 Tax=Camellia sinensis var. sinensis TaxID=542762 RepID=A0A4S4EV37_CAMSN|nr:hypothetical protein TEA_003877 [Camellia sinensis var. sinensis]